MSVINQVLLDLENRRASGAERKTLPNHVRVMPQAARRSRMRLAAIAAVAALALAAAWAAMLPPPDAPPQATRAVTPVPASVPAAAPQPADAPAAPGPELQLAARLSFELSRLPDPLPEPQARLPEEPAIPSTRVLGKSSPDARPVPARAAPPAASRAEARPAVATAPAKARAASVVPETPRAEIDKRVREPTPRELAEAEFRKATAQLHQGRLAEAREGFEAALARYPAHHGARQALLGVLIDAGRTAEAERAMHDGLQLAPHQIGFAIALARLQVDRGDAPAAIVTLRNSLGHAQGNGDYRAFLGGLLQREQRHAEAIEEFHAALRLRPDHGLWLLGLGLSLQALDREAEARAAFQRARTSAALSADLQAFAEQRLRQLQ